MNDKTKVVAPKATKTPAAKTEVKAAAPASNVKYVLGKPYRVRAAHNKLTWDIIGPMLVGGATFADLQKACIYEVDGKPRDHSDFVGYLLSNGNIKVLEAK
jgi:hypothetical protein